MALEQKVTTELLLILLLITKHIFINDKCNDSNFFLQTNCSPSIIKVLS